MITKKLKDNQIPYQYDMLDSLSEDEQNRILDLAAEFGELTMPIVFRDDAIVSAKEVLACC